jgi:hypothetical protein
LEINRVTGELKLAIAFNHNTSCLEITINGCRNLAYGDIKRKKCHPYALLLNTPDYRNRPYPSLNADLIGEAHSSNSMSFITDYYSLLY